MTGAVVLSLPAHSEADEIAALMLAQLLEARGIKAKPISASALASERLEEAAAENIQVVCVSTVPPDGYMHTRYLCKRLREQLPEIRIVVAILAREDVSRKRDSSVPADEVTVTLKEAANAIVSLVCASEKPATQTTSVHDHAR